VARPHHSYYDGAQASRGIFSKGPIVLQKDHHDETVDAEAGEAGQRRGAGIPCDVSGYPTIRIAMEAGRIDPRSSKKVIEMYSSLALKLVREPASPPPHPRDHHVLVVGGVGQYRLDLSLVTLVVTLGRR
jgi:hypothetical protein